jgi:hypothetical protein
MDQGVILALGEVRLTDGQDAFDRARVHLWLISGAVVDAVLRLLLNHGRVKDPLRSFEHSLDQQRIVLAILLHLLHRLVEMAREVEKVWKLYASARHLAVARNRLAVIEVNNMVEQKHFVVAALQLVGHIQSTAETQSLCKTQVRFFVFLQIRVYLASHRKESQQVISLNLSFLLFYNEILVSNFGIALVFVRHHVGHFDRRLRGIFRLSH